MSRVVSSPAVRHASRRRAGSGVAPRAAAVVAALAVLSVGTSAVAVSPDAVPSGVAVEGAAVASGGGAGAVAPDSAVVVQAEGVVASELGVAPGSVVATSLGESVAVGVGVSDALSFVNALLVEGLLTPERYAAVTADPAAMAGLGEALAGGGGPVVVGSAGQVEMDRLLAMSAEQVRGVLAESFDVGVGPSGAQVLALYVLAGGNDFALIEVATNWVFARHPGVELMFDSGEADGAGGFYFVQSGVRVSNPFFDRLVSDLYNGDIVDKEVSDDPPSVGGWVYTSVEPQSYDSDSGEPAPYRNSDTGEGITPRRDSDAGAAELVRSGSAPVWTVRPRFEQVNEDRKADIKVGSSARLDAVAAGLGLVAEGGNHIVPSPRHRYGFDVDDNFRGGKTPGRDTLIVDLLRVVEPSLLSGADHYLVGANGSVLGGLGDDFFLQVGGDTVITPGGGDDTVVITSGEATVAESAGSTVVATVDSAVTAKAGVGVGVDLSVVDDGMVSGDLGVVLATDTTLSADFDTAGTRTFVVAPGASVDVSGGVTSTHEGGLETVVVAGELTGTTPPVTPVTPDAPDAPVSPVTPEAVEAVGGVGVVDLGPGADVFVTSPESVTTDVEVVMGADDDRVQLGGHSTGLVVELGTGSDVALVSDEVTGGARFEDLEQSWVWQKSMDQMSGDDTLVLGDGFGLADPAAGVESGIIRIDADGTIVAEIQIDGDSDHVERIVTVAPDGTVTETLQNVAPEVRRQGGFLRLMKTVLTVAGIATGQVWLSVAAQMVGGAEQVINGGNAFDVVVGAGTGIVGAVTGMDWIASAGAAAIAVKNDDLMGAVAPVLGTVGGVHAQLGGFKPAASGFTKAGQVVASGLTINGALKADGAEQILGLTAGGLGLADVVSDAPVIEQAGAAVTVATAALTGNILNLVMASAELTNKLGGFDSLKARKADAPQAQEPLDLSLQATPDVTGFTGNVAVAPALNGMNPTSADPTSSMGEDFTGVTNDPATEELVNGMMTTPATDPPNATLNDAPIDTMRCPKTPLLPAACPVLIASAGGDLSRLGIASIGQAHSLGLVPDSAESYQLASQPPGKGELWDESCLYALTCDPNLDVLRSRKATVYYDPKLSKEERTAAEKAVKYWDDITVLNWSRTTDPTQASVVIRSKKVTEDTLDAVAEAGCLVTVGISCLQKGINIVTEHFRELDPVEQHSVMRHELGHTVGFGHYQSGVMNGEGGYANRNVPLGELPPDLIKLVNDAYMKRYPR